MSVRVVVPIHKNACQTRQVVMPAELSPYLHTDDFAASMERLQVANRSPALARLVYVAAWVVYVWGLMQMITVGYSYGHFYFGFGLLLSAFIIIVGVGRFMRLRRAAKVAAAVQAEHAVYSLRAVPLAWTLVQQGWYRQAVEIEVLQSVQQLQIHHLQHELSHVQQQAQQQQAHLQYDAAVIAQQQQVQLAEAQVIAQQQQWIQHHQQHPHMYPAVASPRPAYAPMPSVFAHPSPSYYAPPAPTAMYAPQPQAQDNLRTPLMHNPY